MATVIVDEWSNLRLSFSIHSIRTYLLPIIVIIIITVAMDGRVPASKLPLSLTALAFSMRQYY